MVKPFPQGHITSQLWSRYLIPGSPAQELKPTTTGKHSLPADLSLCVHQKAISNIPQEMPHFEVFLSCGEAALDSFNYFQGCACTHTPAHTTHTHKYANTYACTHTQSCAHAHRSTPQHRARVELSGHINLRRPLTL